MSELAAFVRDMATPDQSSAENNETVPKSKSPEKEPLKADIKKTKNLKTKDKENLKPHQKDKPREKSHKSRRERIYDSYSSDEDKTSESSRSKRHHKVKKEKKRRSYSESDDEYEDRKFSSHDVKEEFYNEDGIYGNYYCQVCSITMNSKGTLRSHMSGKRHLKEVKKQDSMKAVSESVKVCNLQSRYPMPPPNVIRVPVNDIAQSQSMIDMSVTSPCPGLSRVIAIEGLTENSFYCELCDSPCSSSSIVQHLKGFKHQLNCLKYYDLETYERFQYKKKHEIERDLIALLRRIEREKGRGYLRVEKETLSEEKKVVPRNIESSHRHKESTSRETSIDEPVAGPSHRPDLPYTENVVHDNRPDYYCDLCDSHMNSRNMWEAHIRGKRHLANKKKAPGERPSKVKSVPIQAPAKLNDLLADVYEPVVGLKHMRETQNPESEGPTYNCFLCGACMTSHDVVEHILSPKHRTRFLENMNHPDIQMIKEMAIGVTKMYSIIEETCEKYEEEYGRGEIEVHIMRNAIRKW